MPKLAEKPPEVPGLTRDEALAELARTGSRTSFAWTDPHTHTVWCKLPGCHYARTRRSEVCAHYYFRHLKQSRNRLPLCEFCDYSSSSIGQHSIVHVQRSGTVKCKQECGKAWYATLESPAARDHMEMWCPRRIPPRGNMNGRTWIQAEKRFNKVVTHVKGEATPRPIQASAFDFSAPSDQARAQPNEPQQTLPSSGDGSHPVVGFASPSLAISTPTPRQTSLDAVHNRLSNTPSLHSFNVDPLQSIGAPSVSSGFNHGLNDPAHTRGSSSTCGPSGYQNLSFPSPIDHQAPFEPTRAGPPSRFIPERRQSGSSCLKATPTFDASADHPGARSDFSYLDRVWSIGEAEQGPPSDPRSGLRDQHR